MKEIGPFFNALIKDRKITQKAFAKMIGISEQHIRHVLNSNGDVWKVEWLERACLGLNVHPRRFFNGWPEVKNNNVVVGDIENEAVLGVADVSIVQNNDDSREKDLQSRVTELERDIKSKDEYIISLKRVVELQNKIINDNGIMI